MVKHLDDGLGDFFTDELSHQIDDDHRIGIVLERRATALAARVATNNVNEPELVPLAVWTFDFVVAERDSSDHPGNRMVRCHRICIEQLPIVEEAGGKHRDLGAHSVLEVQ